MAYSVDLTRQAADDIALIYDYIEAGESDAAARWYRGLTDLILTLDKNPQRGQSTHEMPALRQLLYGNKPHFYRIIYDIGETTQTVTVLHVRHRARTAFRASDVTA